ncbi:putative alpha-mannosidase [Helianthus anomalus]
MLQKDTTLFNKIWWFLFKCLVIICFQVTRLYKDKEHAEFEFSIGPIPTDDGVAKEVITRITANMVTDKLFYADSNGRDFLKRVRDYKEDWPLEVTQPIAGNYYPVTLGSLNKDMAR